MEPYLLAAAAALVSVVAYLLLKQNVTPEERERRRRRLVNAAGRVTDGLISEVRTQQAASGAVSYLIFYTYDLRGVTYSASQDITGVLAYLDRDPGRIAGPASIKYLPENPSNSIVISEEWSGLR